jgi:hypothetical protein
MEKEIAAKTLDTMAEAGGLDKNIVELANDNFSLINDVRIQEQEKALNEYMAFYQQGCREVTKS